MGGIVGGGKGGGSVSAPDFSSIAQQQAALSQQNVNAQTLANRVNQANAFGATSGWTQGPDGRWTQTSSYGGPLGTAIGNLTGQVAGQGALPTGQAARDQAITAAYNQAASRLDPMWAQREQATQSQLAAQGLDPTSQAAQATMGNFGRARNDAYTSALASAIGQGTEAGNALFQQGVTSQMLPYQQLGAIQSLGQQAGVPMAGQAQTPDLMGAAGNQYQAALNQNAQQQAGKNSMLSGLGSLAGTLIMPGIGTALGGALGGGLGSILAAPTQYGGGNSASTYHPYG